VSHQKLTAPQNAGIIYASTSLPDQDGRILLDHAVSTLLDAENETKPASILWSLHYTQSGPSPSRSSQSTTSPSVVSEKSVLLCPPPSLDLAFDDALIEDVREKWKVIMGDEALEEEFMMFETREGVGEEGQGSDGE